jgi:hypothetical protein
MATTLPATPEERPSDRTKAIASKRLLSRAALVVAGVILVGLVPAEAKINKGPPQVHNAQWFQHQKCLNDPKNCPSPSGPGWCYKRYHYSYLVRVPC